MEETSKKDLVLGTLERGADYIAEYIMKDNLCNFSISNIGGHVFYEKNVLTEMSKSELGSGKLTYTVDTYEGPIILTMTGLASDKLEQGMNSLKNVEFAVQCFFSLGNRQKSSVDSVNGGVVKYTLDKKLDRNSLLNITNTHCDPTAEYYVSILNDCTKDEQRYMAGNLKRTHTFNISIRDPQNLILIVRHMYNPLTNSIDINAPSKAEQQGKLANLLQLYNGNPKFATGNSCYPPDIYMSYQQAMFTMSLMKLTGHKSFSQRFSDLSMGIPLASNNWLAIKQYCEKNIGGLLECDKINKTDYFSTLNSYLDHNCNGKETADELYIHVNTLYYRLRKIEEILGYSTSNLNDTSHLFYVTKIYGALIESGILNDVIEYQNTLKPL